MTSNQIPYNDIRTIFLDAGNTLVSMDFEWVRKELEHCGLNCKVQELRRAEAAARPIVSAELERLKSTEGEDTFIFYLQSILGNLSATSTMEDRIDEVVRELLQIFQSPDQMQRLWSCLLPGVRDALDMLQEKGFQLLVVSNSNGGVEEGLSRLDLRHYFDSVIDSHEVGFEKPDPRLFQYALEVSGAIPEQTLHIGDLYHVDILGAWSAGIHALLLDPFGDWDNIKCERLPDLYSLASRIIHPADP